MPDDERRHSLYRVYVNWATDQLQHELSTTDDAVTREVIEQLLAQRQ